MENLFIVQELVRREQLIKKVVASAFLKDQKTSMSGHSESKQFSGSIIQQQKSNSVRRAPRHNSEYGDEEIKESQDISEEDQMKEQEVMKSASSFEEDDGYYDDGYYEEHDRHQKRSRTQLAKLQMQYEGGSKTTESDQSAEDESSINSDSNDRQEESKELRQDDSSSQQNSMTIPTKFNQKNEIKGGSRNKHINSANQQQNEFNRATAINYNINGSPEDTQMEDFRGYQEEQTPSQGSSKGSQKHIGKFFPGLSSAIDNDMSNASNSLSSRQRTLLRPSQLNMPPQKPLGHYLRELIQARQLEEHKENIQKDENKRNLDDYFDMFGITPDQVQSIEISKMEELLRLKQHFKQDSITVMTQILKSTIAMGEAKISWIITLEYQITIDGEMFFNAVQTENFQWLFFLWASKKNYIVHRNDKKLNDIKSKQTKFMNKMQDDNSPPLFITFEHLFDLIIHSSDQFGDRNRIEQNIKRVLDWHITADDTIENNIIRCLLAHHLDVIAVDYMGVYNNLLNKDLLIYCIDHGNQYFMRNSLLLAAFDKMLFREEQVINELLTILRRGYSTNFILNIISLIDISVWKNKRLKSLIEIINEYVEDKYNQNRLLLSPNPLMSITLACEILTKIADARRKFDSECYQIQQSMLKLGMMYTKKIEDENYYESLIMKKDFNDRNIVKIITQNNFGELMHDTDPKAERVMMMIWRGKEAAHCDGDIFGYSNLAHIIFSKPKKIVHSADHSFIQIVTNFFTMSENLNYGFQYRFRIESIQFYFYKELLCAFLMLIIFQYVNYRYLILFSNKVLRGVEDPLNIWSSSLIAIAADNQTANGTSAHYLPYVNKSVDNYVEWAFPVVFLSAALIFQLGLKICFNIFSNLKIGLDKWTIMDTISATLNILAVVLIQKIDPNMYLQPKMKDLIDYFMLLVLTVSWLRFFSYFLVVRSISKLLLTLIEMIGDTLSFLFIVSCFILIMSSVFATLYQDNYPEKYGGLAKTVATLFSGVVAQYWYDDEQMKGRVISHSVLTIFHVFFTNIILMNYLIAILSSTYSKMRQSGIFSFKVNLYQYCERFLTAFKDRDYGELVMHAPPLSFLCGLLLPFVWSRPVMARLSKGLSYLMYWIENGVFLFIFMLFEILIAPFAYCKVWYNLMLMQRITSSGQFWLKGVLYKFCWTWLGPFFIIYIISLDIGNFAYILVHHDGFTRTKEEKIAANRVDDTLKVQLYNETRSVVISLFQRISRLIAKESEQQNGDEFNLLEDTSDDEDLDRIPDFYIIEDQKQFGLQSFIDQQQCFVLKKSFILEEWKKRREIIEQKIRSKNADFSSSNDNTKSHKDRMMKFISKGFKNQLDAVQKAHMRRQSMPFSHWEQTMLTSQKLKQNKPGARSTGQGNLFQNVKEGILDKINNIIKKSEDKGDKKLQDFEIPEEEIKIVDTFLSKFIILSNQNFLFRSDNSSIQILNEISVRDQIDIKLMIKALPNKIMSYTLDTIDMLNFRIFQESLYAHQNSEIVKAFEFFDEKNKQRVQVVKNRLISQREVIADASDLLDRVVEKIDQTFNNDELKQKILAKQQTIAQTPQNRSKESSKGGLLHSNEMSRANTHASQLQMLQERNNTNMMSLHQQTLTIPTEPYMQQRSSLSQTTTAIPQNIDQFQPTSN